MTKYKKSLIRGLCFLALVSGASSSINAAISAFSGATDMGDGWYVDENYGTFYPVSDNWIWHEEHGWQWIPEGGNFDVEGTYVWDYNLSDWLWANAGLYPWIYDFGDLSGWLKYTKGGLPTFRSFYWVDNESWYYETPYAIVGTNQTTFFDSSTEIDEPVEGDDYYGQNANYPGNTPSYTDNGDGTVTDNITGLMWQNTLDHNGDGEINYDDKLTYFQILDLVESINAGTYTGDDTAGYTDWRLPSIKEQYSLIMFSGRDISGYEGDDTSEMIPFINTDYFGYNYGDTTAGERLIDVQCASTNISVDNDEMVFGVNFADGRIKGYGMIMMGEEKVFNYLLVRGNTQYGINDFEDNGDGTITDHATHLMWMQDDSGEGMNWKDALSYAENFEYAGYTDWRLPSAKELQSIVDYSRAPGATDSAAIDPLFNCTEITNEAGEKDYGYYWSSTTHANMMEGSEGGWGAYVAFGRAMGNESDDMILLGIGDSIDDSSSSDEVVWTDVHGAGAQRSDPKDGDPDDYPTGNGPQGDAIRIFNFVRLVRDL